MQNTRMATRAAKTAADIPTDDHIVGMVVKARAAMAWYADEIAAHGQARIDEAVTAMAWSMYKPARARRLAELEVEVTGIGAAESKVVNNEREPLSTLRDLQGGKSTRVLAHAAHKIMQSKTFDHATSCSSENALVIVDAVYDMAIAALRREGGYLATAAERARIVDRLWQDGKLNRAVIAQGSPALIDAF